MREIFNTCRINIMRKLLLPFMIVSLVFISAFVMSSTVFAKTCGGVEVSVLPNCDTGSTGGGGSGGNSDVQNSGVWKLLELALNIMIGLVGVVAIGGIVYGAIMYTSAQDNASQVQEAVGIIRNVIIGLVLFVSMYAVLQYLIPGGVF